MSVSLYDYRHYTASERGCSVLIRRIRWPGGIRFNERHNPDFIRTVVEKLAAYYPPMG